MNVNTKNGICRFCHATCPVSLQFDGDRIVNIIGNKNNPVYWGYSCIKGRNFHEWHYDKNRLLHPLQRDGNGDLTRTTLDDAIDKIAARLDAIIKQHGPRAVAMYSGTFSHFAVDSVMTRMAFMAAIGSPMSFSNATIDQPGKPIAMAMHGCWGAGPQSFAESDVCLLVGANTLVSMWGGIPAFNPAKRLHVAKQRGLKLIVIDPRRTETARKADLHLQCLPGHDSEILAAIINVIIAESLYDRDFVEAESEGFEHLAATVAAFTPEHVAAVAGIDSTDLIAAARLFAAGQSGNATGGTGSNMAPNGTLTEYLLLCLNTICGRWVRAGEQVPNLGVLYRMYSGQARAEKPRPAFGFGEALRVRGLGNTAAGMPTAALADEILTPGDGQVKALFVVGGNPLTAFPNRNKVERALQSLDLLVVVDPQLTATGQLADFVIGPKTGFELPAVTFANEGMTVYGLSIGYQEPWAMYQPALIEAPEGADILEDWRFFFELARRMQLPLSYRSYNYDFNHPPTTDELIAEFCRHSPVPLDDIKPHPEGRLFAHRSAPAEAKDPEWPYKLRLGVPEMMADLVSLARPAPKLAVRPSTEELELLLISRREHEVYNSVGHRLPKLKQKLPFNPAHMNPTDADRLGLKSSDMIEIYNATGSVPARVEVAGDVRPGVISVAHGFPNYQRDKTEFMGTSTAALIDDETEYDNYSGLPRMSAVPVRVRPARNSRR